MSKALIIAEKPSVAQDIVRALTPSAGRFDKHDEYFEGDGVCLVEWADRAAGVLPAEHLRVELAVVSETARRATVEGFGARYETVVRELAGCFAKGYEPRP